MFDAINGASQLVLMLRRWAAIIQLRSSHQVCEALVGCISQPQMYILLSLRVKLLQNKPIPKTTRLAQQSTVSVSCHQDRSVGAATNTIRKLP